MAIIYPFPHYWNFTELTPTVPSFYWDTYSQEERIKALCDEYAKLIAYTDAMSSTVNSQYEIIRGLEATFPDLVNEAITPALQEYTESGALRVYIDSALAGIYSRLDTAEADIRALQTVAVPMVGATETQAGAAGYVPAPGAGDNTKFLCGSGTWETVTGGGGGGGGSLAVQVNGSAVGDAETLNFIAGNGVSIAGLVAGTTVRLTTDFNASTAGLATVATTGSYNDLTDKPAIPSGQVQSDWAEVDTSSPAYIKNKPVLAQVATTGSYNDLTDKPTIPSGQVQTNWEESNPESPAYLVNRPAVDSTPTLNSQALITSDGVAGAMNTLNAAVSAVTINPSTKICCIGDSFLQGYATEGMVTPWGTIIGNLTGATVQNFAEGGIGWSTTGQAGHVFSDLVDSAFSTMGENVDIVIIAGGYNDSMAEKTSAEIATGASNAATKIRQYWPDASVYFFPNIWGNGYNSAGTNTYGYPDEENAKAIKRAMFTRTTGKPINVVMGCWTWLYANTQSGFISSDGVHPLEPGQAIIAHSMLQAMNGQDPTVYYDNYFGSGFWLMRTYMDVMVQLNGVGSSITLPRYYYLTQAAAAMGSGSSTSFGLYLLQQGRKIASHNGASTNMWGSMFSRMSCSRY